MPYSTLAQCQDDLTLLYTAEELEPGRREGETLTAYLKKKIRNDYKNSTKKFQLEQKKMNYTFSDLQLIALHDLNASNGDLRQFLSKMKQKKTKEDKLRLIIKSQAFKSGRLDWLYSFLPRQMDCKEDLVEFIKMYGYITRPELFSICKTVTRKNWKKWIRDAVQNKEICDARGGWR